MEKTLIQIATFKLGQLPEHLKEIEKLAYEANHLEFYNFDQIEKIVEFSEQNPNIFYVFNIESKQDFVNINKHLKTLNKFDIQFKAIVFFDFDQPKAENILLNLGCSNILKNNTTTKNFTLKVNALLRALDKIIKEKGSNLRYKEMGSGREEESQENRATPKKKNIGLGEVNKKLIKRKLHPTIIGPGEVTPFNNKKELKESKFEKKSKAEVSAEILSYINEQGKKGNLSLEAGELKVGLKDQEQIKCDFIDFAEEEIIIEAHGPMDVALELECSFLVKFVYDKCKVELELDGRVIHIERHEANSRYVTLKLLEPSEDKLEYFMSLYERRQKSIDQFINLARGIN